MEKKRSFGVTILGFVMVLYIFYLVMLLYYLSTEFLYVGHTSPFEGISHWVIMPIIYCIFLSLTSLVYLICSVNILRLKNWSRIITVYYSAFTLIVLVFLTLPITSCIIKSILSPETLVFFKQPYLLVGLVFAIFIVPFPLFNLIFLFFFTRPKIKVQFASENEKLEQKTGI